MRAFIVVLAVLGAVVVTAVPSARAQSQEDWDKLRFQVMELDKQIKELTEKSTPSWLDRFTFKGDFRYRYEMIDQDGKDTRNRSRFRARVFMGAEVNEQVDFGFQLATGMDDPVSTNQTIGNGFSPKAVFIDQAYFDYHPLEGDVALNFVGGKMKTPFAVMSKSELLWDPDLRPEGLAVNFAQEFGESIEFFGHAGLFYIEERKSAADARMVGGQVGLTIEVAEATSLTAGAGYYDYGQVENNPTFPEVDNSSGNSATLIDPDPGASGDEFLIYDNDYNELEVFGEVATKVADLPLAVFGNYVENTEADNEEAGWVAGIKVGKAKDPGTWDFRYQYKRLGKDAVIGAFTDSDFGGGGTNAKGHEFNVNHALDKNWVVGVSYFLNDINIHGGEDETDYERLQVDLKFKF